MGAGGTNCRSNLYCTHLSTPPSTTDKGYGEEGATTVESPMDLPFFGRSTSS